MLFGRPLMPSIEKSALKRRQIVAGGEPRSGAAPGKEDAGMSPGRGDRGNGKPPFLSPLPGLGIVAGLTPGSAAARLARGYCLEAPPGPSQV